MDPVAIYGAVLSTVIVVFSGGKYLYEKRLHHKEKDKIYISLNNMITNDPKTKEKVDIAFILFANLGKSTIVLKEVEYFGEKSKGSPGWYQEPEATYGLMKRVLPAVLKSGDVVELPLFYLAFFKHEYDRMILRDIEDKEYDVPKNDILRMRKKLNEKKG